MAFGLNFVALSLALAIAQQTTNAIPFYPSHCSPGPYIVFFAGGSAVLDATARETLANMADAAANCSPLQYTVTGNSDAAEPYRLSRARAEAVRRYMSMHGFARRQIKVRWLGNTQPRVATNASIPELQNRGVTILWTLDQSKL